MSRYTGPKFKLCRREWINLFGVEKYNVKNRRGVPGQHWANQPRLSEYGKLLRNKQVLKRIYQMNEKQFNKLVNETSKKYAKNKSLDHDKVLYQFLERRLDNVVLKSGFAKTIMQARQMVVHGHFNLNWRKHNVPSYFVELNDIISLREKLQSSDLYSDTTDGNPIRLSVDKPSYIIKILDFPIMTDDNRLPADILKVIEY